MRSCIQGTLDLMVLKTLETLGPMHGYAVARRIEQVSDDALQLNQGTLYPALVRLEQRRWITLRWGVSDNNRRARYYELTKTGRKEAADRGSRQLGTHGRDRRAVSREHVVVGPPPLRACRCARSYGEAAP